MKKATVLFILLACAVSAFASMELTSARVYRKQGDFIKALNFYNQALQKEPGNLEALMERGEIYHDLAIDASKGDVAKQVTNNAANPEELLLDRSLADFAKASVAANPKEEGTVKKNKKKIDEILQTTWNHYYFQAVVQDSLHKKAISENPASPDAKNFLFAGLSCLNKASKVLPDKWNSYGFKAQLYSRMDSTEASARNWELAIAKIKMADKAKQETEEYKMGLAIAKEAYLVDCYNLGRSNDVLVMSDDILKDDPKNINAIQLKANTLAKMTTDTSLSEAKRDSLKQVAIKALQSAEQADTTNADIIYTIAQFKLQLADTAGAINAFKDVLRINPKDKDVSFVLGVLYLEGGSFVDTKKAKDVFEGITKDFPDEGKAWINYGISLIRLGDNAKGKEAIDRGNALLKGEK
jgi:tetratricopeptide (TPR) repeat protein